MLETFFAKLAGKWLAKKANLKDGPMDDTKKWWASKGVWAGIITGLLGIYATLQPVAHLPAIPEWIFALLGGIGVYTRATATKQIQ